MSTQIFDPQCNELIAKITFTGFAFMVMVGFHSDATVQTTKDGCSAKNLKGVGSHSKMNSSLLRILLNP